MLNDVTYIDEVKKKMLIWREEAKEILDKRVIWDWIKYNIRLYSIDYKRRAKGNRGGGGKDAKEISNAQANFEKKKHL